MNTSTLFVLAGGPGGEHEVSLASGANLALAGRDVFDAVRLLVLEKNGKWTEGGSEVVFADFAEEMRDASGMVFPIIHGEYGEDGGLAALLESEGIPFVGSSSEAMRVTIDKFATGEFLAARGFRTPKSKGVRNMDNIRDLDFSFPCILKPIDEGSSISLYKIQSFSELEEALSLELSRRDGMLLQEFVKWREFTCAVARIGGKNIALEPTEIILTHGDLFDYAAKYTPNACQEITPADVPAELRDSIRELALQTHEAMGCRDISRTDIILSEAGELVILEINTLPGMTKTSFFPAQLVASGYSLGVFLGELKRGF